MVVALKMGVIIIGILKRLHLFNTELRLVFVGYSTEWKLNLYLFDISNVYVIRYNVCRMFLIYLMFT